MIPYGRQEILDEDIEAVIQVLKSDFLTQGPAVPRFEEAIKKVTHAKYAIAMNSATSALHAACAALDLKEGDWLWTSPNTFVASANCARYCGAQVDFVDIDSKTANLCVNQLENKLKEAKAKNRLPKILIPVHLSGLSCDMEGIARLTQAYGIKIIEDASHAIGASYRERPVGSCDFSDIVVFSFHPVKIVTTGEGGAAVTNDASLAARMARFRTHGITRDPSEMSREPDGPWYYEQIDLGWNYRMTDIQAALGVSQMQRLEKYVHRRNELAKRYDQLLKELPIQRPILPTDSLSSFHLYVVRVSSKNHRKIFEGLRSRGIGVNLHYIPVHFHPYYQSLGFKKGQFPEAERYYSEAISLPLFAQMTESEQDQVVAALKSELET
ncbi:MAG: UDP-4-amino-4,6-dideoxy-N-acetyl-beta-L-altrosamine transaminase [Bdellovibrionota bacterium]